MTRGRGGRTSESRRWERGALVADRSHNVSAETAGLTEKVWKVCSKEPICLEGIQHLWVSERPLFLMRSQPIVKFVLVFAWITDCRPSVYQRIFEWGNLIWDLRAKWAKKVLWPVLIEFSKSSKSVHRYLLYQTRVHDSLVGVEYHYFLFWISGSAW